MKPMFRFALILSALVVSGLPVFGQTPPAMQTAAFLAKGSTADAEIARLKAALAKLPGADQVEIVRRADRLIVRIRGGAGGTLAAAAAKPVGFALQPMPRFICFASRRSGVAAIDALRQTLGKIEGMERLDVSGTADGAMLRVTGDVKASALAEAAKSAGFDLRRISSYVAAGRTGAKDIALLRTALQKTGRIAQMDVRAVDGGAVLRLQGTMEDEDVTQSAKSAGFGILPLNDLVGGQFLVNGEPDSAAENALLTALKSVQGMGELQISKTTEGTLLSVQDGTVIPEAIVAAAKTAGFYLRPGKDGSGSPAVAEVEQNTPPAPNDRILEELTKVGDLAPDFTLITKDGKSKISLSDFRGKKPVVLIFGSYT